MLCYPIALHRLDRPQTHGGRVHISARVQAVALVTRSGSARGGTSRRRGVCAPTFRDTNAAPIARDPAAERNRRREIEVAIGNTFPFCRRFQRPASGVHRLRRVVPRAAVRQRALTRREQKKVFPARYLLRLANTPIRPR